MNRKILFFSITVLLLISIATVASCTVDKFDISGGQIVTKSVGLNKNDICSGSIEVTSGDPAGLNIVILDPNQNYVATYPGQIFASFNFTAQETGTYLFGFQVAGGSTPKTVNLNYNIAGSFSILPRGTIVTAALIVELIFVIAVIVIVLAVIVLLFVRRRRRKGKMEAAEAPPAPPATPPEPTPPT